MKLNEFIETLFREEEDSSLSPERISSISSALLRAPITSTLRVNTLRITIEEGISLLRDHLSSSFSLRQCPEIPELLLIDGIRNCCESTAGLEVQVSPDAGKAFLRGADIYAAGVVAVECDSGETAAATAAADSDRLCSVWVCMDGKCTKGLKKPYSGPKEFLGMGRLRMTRDQIFLDGGAKGLAIEQIQNIHGLMPSFDGLDRGLLFPQNLPSVAAVRALVDCYRRDIAGKGEEEDRLLCLDMCASPGGKTLHLAALLETYWPGCSSSYHTLISADKNPGKVAKLRENVRLVGAERLVQVIQMDSAHAQNNQKNNRTDNRMNNQTDNRLNDRMNDRTDNRCDLSLASFDLIILDPPCSGIGQRPVFEWGREEDQPLEALKQPDSPFSQYQERLMGQAVRLVKPGGMILYCTCTMAPQENERVIARTLEAHEGSLMAVKDNLPFGHAGLAGHGLPDPSVVRRFWPDDPEEDTIGFFYAILKKTK